MSEAFSKSMFIVLPGRFSFLGVPLYQKSIKPWILILSMIVLTFSDICFCFAHSPPDCYWWVWVNSLFEASWLSGTVRDLQARGRRFDPRLRWICFDVVLLGKVLCSHVHSLDPGVSGYLVGQWRLVSLNSSVHWKNGSPPVCSPGSWDGLWTSRSYDQGVIVWSRASGASR